jgi:Fe-S-cluster containining protein
MAESIMLSCTCSKCQALCAHKPGWFKPGEAEKVANFLGITLQELFNSHLMPDSWELPDGSIQTLSPAIKGQEPGEYMEGSALGECVFFKDGLCSIHAVKPYECRSAGHTPIPSMHRAVAISWIQHQDQIEALRMNLSGK